MTMQNFNYKNYELTTFARKTTNRTVTLAGYKVGDWLIIAKADDRRDSGYRIYRINDGLLALKTVFADAKDAILFAEWIDKTYVDTIHDMSYFAIWTEYPHAEIFRWTKYTIPNGEKYMTILEAMENQKNVRWEDVSRYLD
jgi:hypothetical protein